jgi:hypothetical protein
VSAGQLSPTESRAVASWRALHRLRSFEPREDHVRARPDLQERLGASDDPGQARARLIGAARRSGGTLTLELPLP